MLQRVLVPLDGSPLAESALPVAARIARVGGGQVILFRVYQLSPNTSLPEAVVSAYDSDEREASGYLDAIAARSEFAGIMVEQHVFGGETAMSILNATVEYKADLVVMTSHGRSGLTRWVMGSVAEHVVRHALVPVFVLRGPGGNVVQPKRVCGADWRVLVTLDGSELAESAIEPARLLLDALRAYEGGELLLLRLVKPLGVTDDETAASTALSHVSLEEMHTYVLHYAAEYMAKIARATQARAEDVPVRWAVAEARNVAEGIMRDADAPARLEWHAADGSPHPLTQDREPGVSFIAMATHGHGGLQRWTLGSVAEHTLEATALPLLLVRPEQPEEPKGPIELVDVTRA
jgi:nucleotide-binding universal stress UspA family protein